MHYRPRIKNRNRIIGGWKAKKLGDEFQKIVKQCAERQGLTCEIIHDGAKRTGFGGLAIKHLPQPFDMILFYESKVLFLDCKSRNATNPTKAVLIKKNKKKIHNSSEHQLNVMFKIENKHNHVAGFITYLRKSKKVVFARAKDVYFTTKGIVPHLDITLENSSDILPLPDFKKLFTQI